MDTLIERIISGQYEEWSTDIKTLQDNFGSKTKFEELNKNNLRERLLIALFNYLTDDLPTDVHSNCLSTMRILSRDKVGLNEIITEERIKTILKNAKLLDINEENGSNNYTDITIESLKLLCNLLFNSSKVQELIPKTSCLKCLTNRMSHYSNVTPYNIKLFDVRILFLITALNVPTRNTVYSDLKGDECLIKMLRDLDTESNEDGKCSLQEDDVILACEVLKALFNLYIQSDEARIDRQEKTKGLVSILYDLLIIKCDAKQDDLRSNIVNLLTVIPYDCYAPIIPTPANVDSEGIYKDADMSAISILLEFLNERLNCKKDLIANLSPVVTALLRLVKVEKLVRKYVRLQILPPLKDVMNRPEEGTTLRAKLCKLLTSPLTELRDLVAEFLFVLCKENVSRMVKYTGYGNAAGMFANKGLLGNNREKSNYSSESEDSDTEEYLKHKEQINPVTGCFEAPKLNPLEGMTEEQKEYEALQLLNLVDKLAKEGIMQPCRIGEDGKPKPISHVLELQEELPKQQYTRRDSESD